MASIKRRPGQTLVDDDDDDDDEEFGADASEVKQRYAVAQALLDRGVRVSPFTSDENRWQRREILRRFRTGETEAMVAIKCLDEGIDVPACRSAYLIASSRNPRQFIQRRGRILRRSPGKEKATIYDFVVVIRLVLNQIGRRLTEHLHAESGANAAARHKLLMMLDEFPALGRLDFFETSLAFLAGYGVRAFLIAQSLNQIEKAYGDHNAILDNCHVRVAFATNDERTAKRISDALGTATEQRAMRNYAGHRLAPWLAHVMVSRQETARALLTPGEVMQLPPTDELVLLAGTPPIRASKLRYYEDSTFTARILPPPALAHGEYADRPASRPDDWAGIVRGVDVRLGLAGRSGTPCRLPRRG